MEIKQKHGKHALRKAVTAAVLAGTAFSSLGGFAGAVTTIKADELDKSRVSESDRSKFIDLIVDKNGMRRNGKTEKDILDGIRDLLKNASIETLSSLLNGLDPAHLTYRNGDFSRYNTYLGSFNNDDAYDYYHGSLSLATLLVREIKDRIIQNETRKEEIKEKNIELDSRKEREQELLLSKTKLEDLAQEVNAKVKDLENKLLEKENELEENKDELTETLENLEKVKESVKDKEASVKELSERLDTSKKNHA